MKSLQLFLAAQVTQREFIPIPLLWYLVILGIWLSDLCYKPADSEFPK